MLGRAVTVAAPAGLIIWLLANIYAGDISLLAHCANFLDPFAHFIGLDGVILMAFIPVSYTHLSSCPNMAINMVGTPWKQVIFSLLIHSSASRGENAGRGDMVTP